MSDRVLPVVARPGAFGEEHPRLLSSMKDVRYRNLAQFAPMRKNTVAIRMAPVT
jgi:hypothetical protein